MTPCAFCSNKIAAAIIIPVTARTILFTKHTYYPYLFSERFFPQFCPGFPPAIFVLGKSVPFIHFLRVVWVRFPCPAIMSSTSAPAGHHLILQGPAEQGCRGGANTEGLPSKLAIRRACNSQCHWGGGIIDGSETPRPPSTREPEGWLKKWGLEGAQQADRKPPAAPEPAQIPLTPPSGRIGLIGQFVLGIYFSRSFFDA